MVLEPSYGQLDYYSPVLLFLAREQRRPLCQRLALWDRSLGRLQRTRYVTPHGEELLFAFGGYAYLWYDPGLPALAEAAAARGVGAGKAGGASGAGDGKLSYHFPSVGEAYLRASWKPGDLLVGVRKGELVVHAGGPRGAGGRGRRLDGLDPLRRRGGGRALDRPRAR
ncbi:MAG: hypothetical protein HY721_31390 [Planctomycetes bacterium]|nr:hypothetical protein [Planctomycetota bacterium]